MKLSLGELHLFGSYVDRWRLRSCWQMMVVGVLKSIGENCVAQDPMIIYKLLLLMVWKSQGQPPKGCIKPYEYWCTGIHQLVNRISESSAVGLLCSLGGWSFLD